MTEVAPKVTFHTYKSCWVKITGERYEGSGMPRLPSDGGLVQRFGRWLVAQEIHPARWMVQGPGIYEAIFHPEDGERIRAWLLGNGCVEEGH